MSDDSPTALADRDVLVLSDVYNNFAKRQIERLAERVAHVTVLVRYNRFADVGEYLPIDRLEPHTASSRVDRTDLPENVSVETAPLLYLPVDYHYDRLGGKFLARVRDVLADRGVDDPAAAFDLVHAHFTWPCGYAAAMLGGDDLPSVLTVHENEDWLTDLYESGREGVYEAWREVDAVVRVNEKDVPLLARFNDDVHAIPNGFSRDAFPDMDREVARAELGIDDDADVVFGLGAMHDRKRWRDLVDAAAMLDRDVTCAVAGRGDGSSLERRVRDRDLSDSFDVLGYVPQDELACWMNAADVFVLPSEAEGNPTVMFEALACGTPYVGTNVGGAPEIITDERYGLLCEPGDVATLAENVQRGLDRDWDREAIRSYAEQFTWDAIVERLVDEVYAEVLDLPRADRPAP